MSSNFPTSKQTFTDPNNTDPLNSPSHSAMHTTTNDTVEAIQDKLGVTSSAPAANKILMGDGANSSQWNIDFKDEDNMASDSATAVPSQQSVKAYVDNNKTTAINNLLKNGNFINNSTNGYGSTPDDWTSSSANPVQGGFPSMTKAELIALLGISDGDIEGLWNLNEASGNATDLSSNAYHLTDTNTVGASDDGLMGKARDFEKDNSEYFTIADASCANLEISGSQTWFAWIKPETIPSGVNANILTKRNTKIKQLWIVNGGGIAFYLDDLSTVNIISDTLAEAGKWYFVCGVYDSSAGKLKVWINGIKKEVAVTGTIADSNGNFVIGAGNEQYDGLIQNAGVLSVALTDSQVKKLFAATLYRGQKIRRATTNATLSQALPEDLVERLRGKNVAIVAKAYQDTASTAQVEINDGTAYASTTTATTGSWVNVGKTCTISASATAITIYLKHSTSDGNSWFKEVAIYEGSSLLYIWYPSYDDISRFSKAMRMEFADLNKGYRIEGDLAFFAGALTTTELTKDGDMGYDTTNNRLYIREQGVMKYAAMT